MTPFPCLWYSILNIVVPLAFHFCLNFKYPCLQAADSLMSPPGYCPPWRVQVLELNLDRQVWVPHHRATASLCLCLPEPRSVCCPCRPELHQPLSRHTTPVTHHVQPQVFSSHIPPSFLCVPVRWNPSTEMHTVPSRFLIRFGLFPACLNLYGSRMCHRLVLICFPALC